MSGEGDLIIAVGVGLILGVFSCKCVFRLWQVGIAIHFNALPHISEQRRSLPWHAMTCYGVPWLIIAVHWRLHCCPLLAIAEDNALHC